MLPAALHASWEVAIDAAGRALESAISLHVFNTEERRRRRHALLTERAWLEGLSARVEWSSRETQQERPAPRIAQPAHRTTRSRPGSVPARSGDRARSRTRIFRRRPAVGNAR
jgi:hypothetical protein